jgi:arylsulfatase A-like enzyme
MKFIRLNPFCRATVFLAVLLNLSANAALSFILTNTAPQAMPRRDSIIFIQVDGLGYGDLSCYGQSKFQTPNLDKLAAGGIRFTNYSVADARSPSHAALLLGKKPAHLRQRADVDVPLAAGEMTIAQVLKKSGYHTGMIGEWNLGDEHSSGAPWEKGFDEFVGYLNYGDTKHFYDDYIWRSDPLFSYDESYTDPINGHWRAWDKANGPSQPGREMLYPNTRGKNQYIPDLFTKAALNFVQNNVPDQFNHYQPFFLLLNYNIPNAKIEVPSDAPFSEEGWPPAEKNKAALIARIDGYIGQLREKLDKTGLTNTVAIFVFSGSLPKKSAETDPDFFHSNISTNDFRVPMMIYWPGKIPAGKISGLPHSPQDFLPTAAEIAHVVSPTNMDGVSILPSLTGRNKK